MTISDIVVLTLLTMSVVFYLFRNEWVYKQRSRIIAAKVGEIDLYWSYDDMMIHFWMWDIKEMRK